MKLEALARGQTRPAVPRGLWRIDPAGRLDLLPLLAWLADWSGFAGEAAAVFHTVLSEAVVAWAVTAARAQGLQTVALGGGCFLNEWLRTAIPQGLAAVGLSVILPRSVPPNDGAISLGQAWVAAATLRQRRN